MRNSHSWCPSVCYCQSYFTAWNNNHIYDMHPKRKCSQCYIMIDQNYCWLFWKSILGKDFQEERIKSTHFSQWKLYSHINHHHHQIIIAHSWIPTLSGSPTCILAFRATQFWVLKLATWWQKFLWSVFHRPNTNPYPFLGLETNLTFLETSNWIFCIWMFNSRWKSGWR